MADDPYRVLGVQKDATDAEIKRTYRKLARQHHPDRNPDDEAAEERFKAIQAAYDQIGTASARKEHDQQRRVEEMFARGGNPFSGFGGGGGECCIGRRVHCTDLQFFVGKRFLMGHDYRGKILKLLLHELWMNSE